MKRICRFIVDECFYNNVLIIYILDDSCDDFENKFGYNSGFFLNDVFWICFNMFFKR